MQIKYNYVEKKHVRYINENFNIQQAFDYIKDAGYRHIPVLSECCNTWIGMISREDILVYKVNGGDMDASIKPLITNQNNYINEEKSFTDVFMTIARLPFIGVVDNDNVFKGIVTHAKVIDVLKDTWGLNRGKYSLTIAIKEAIGELENMLSIFTKQRINVVSVATLDSSDTGILRRIKVTIGKTVTEEQLSNLVSALDKRHRVAYVETLND